MRHIPHAMLACALILTGVPAFAQEDQGHTPDTPVAKTPKAEQTKAAGTAAPVEADTPPPPPAAAGQMDDMPVAELQALDKITARVSSIETKVGDTASFGSLGFTVKACRRAPPENTPESAAFLEVWEAKPGEESKWVYRGWMFASSPALAAMDHPVYDIWLVDCRKVATSAASSAPVPGPAPK